MQAIDSKHIIGRQKILLCKQYESLFVTSHEVLNTYNWHACITKTYHNKVFGYILILNFLIDCICLSQIYVLLYIRLIKSSIIFFFATAYLIVWGKIVTKIYLLSLNIDGNVQICSLSGKTLSIFIVFDYIKEKVYISNP